MMRHVSHFCSLKCVNLTLSVLIFASKQLLYDFLTTLMLNKNGCTKDALDLTELILTKTQLTVLSINVYGTRWHTFIRFGQEV